jgi:hypothetical protein
MALTVKKTIDRHGAFVSGMTALLVGAALVVQALLSAMIGFLSVLGQQYGVSVWQVLLPAVPFALGFFLGLWIVAPIEDGLRLPQVVVRAILATGIASAVLFVVLAVLGVADAFSLDGNLVGQSFPDVRFGDVPGALGRALVNAAQTFVTSLPLGVLAGVLLWIWRRERATRQPLSEPIDEV